MEAPPPDRELLRLDYGESVNVLRFLSDVRFKLLAFVPTVAGAGVGFLSSRESEADLLAGGLIGLAATLGIFLYELRNDEHFARTWRRVVELERRLGFAQVEGSAGSFGAAPEPSTQLLAIGLVYGAAVGAWTYLVAWALLALIDVPDAQSIGGVVGAAVGVVLAFALLRVAGRKR